MKHTIPPLLVALAVCACAPKSDDAATLLVAESSATPRLPVPTHVTLTSVEAADPQLVQGKQVFDQWCVHCHGIGPRYPGTASLAVRDGGSQPAALEQRTNVVPAVVTVFVRNGVSIMPPFRKTEVNDADLVALGAYLARNSGK